jgi:hypothetical protein
MRVHRVLFAAAACALVAGQSYGPLSLNVSQDFTTVPGFVVNTFTADSGTDITIGTALSKLSAGSIFNQPGLFPISQSNGPGDSYVSINNNTGTMAILGAGDLGGTPTPVLDDTKINLGWFTTDIDDIGLGMHIATLTFSDDAQGELSFAILAGSVSRFDLFSISNGIAMLEDTSTYSPFHLSGVGPTKPWTPPPNPNPNPNPNPGGGSTGGSSGTGGNAVPEPVWLGLLAIGTAVIGGLHRRRLSVHHA